jgi:hypothetical protein
VRRLLAANDEAKKRSLLVAVGLQRHHEKKYQETIQRLWDGAIGDLVCLRVYWNGGGVWVRPRQEDQTELEYQLRNWYYFNWMSGDHIVEQHIHNLDVGNWLLKDHPAECNGMGGRQVRTGKEYGEIYDHHFCEFTYGNGVKMFSQCRHIRNCWNSVAEHAHGTKGSADISGAKIYTRAAGSGAAELRRLSGDRAKVEIPFKPARVVLQDFTGVPAWSIWRRCGAMQRLGGDPKKINPLIPVDLVIDHSVQVDLFRHARRAGGQRRNRVRAEPRAVRVPPLGQKAFDNFRVVPPNVGIVHQVNLEYLAKGVFLRSDRRGPVALPDSLVGTDSHTTMINGLGVVGWGVGGIEAEAVMLGQPLYMLMPEVVGFELTGELPPPAPRPPTWC